MEKRPRWQISLVFALAGLAVAAATYVCAANTDYAQPFPAWKTAAGWVSIALCPTQLLFATCIDCEVIGWNGFIMYAIIGATNSALYAFIGYIFASVRKRD